MYPKIRSTAVVLFMSMLMVSFSEAQETESLKLGDAFPEIKGELLSSKKITLPGYCKGKVSVLIVAFRRGTQAQIDTWTKPLMQEFSINEDFRFIEIPMISNFYIWISGYIDNGMRGGIAESMHKNVMTYYGPLGTYFDCFDVQDKKLCYLFLLDKEGEIQFIAKGEANEEELSGLLQKTKALLQSEPGFPKYR